MANILIIYGHPKTPTSFNYELQKRIYTALSERGHKVITRDLYEISFNPLLSSSDLEKIHSNEIPDDIKKEQEEIKKADVIIFIYPIWWAGSPAIIKGYIDRVFSYGFAYKYQGGKVVGLLNDKTAIILNSTGTPSEFYEHEGFHSAIKKVTDEGIFAFCGFKNIKHIFNGNMSALTETEKQKIITSTTNEVTTYITQEFSISGC